MEEKDLIPKQELSYKIVGFNMAALAAYTFISAIPSDGIIIDASLIFFHVILCLILTLAGPRRLQWLLSGVLVLVIGFSTCAGIVQLRGGL